MANPVEQRIVPFPDEASAPFHLVGHGLEMRDPPGLQFPRYPVWPGIFSPEGAGKQAEEKRHWPHF